MSAVQRNQAGEAWPMYRTLVGIAMLCGLLIVVFHQSTRGVIERAREAALEEAVSAVLPDADRIVSYALNADGRFEPVGEAGTAERVHAGFDETGRLVGVAIEARGMGYADRIRLIYGYDPARKAIVGLEVLESKETPGLGGKIRSDADFLAGFERLDARLDESGERLRHRISAVTRGRPSEPWQVDAITGATVSSKAVADIVHESGSRWLPLIERRLDELAGGKPDGLD